MVQAALSTCVIGLADGEEVRCQAARHHLPGVHKDVRRKQAERKHTCGGKMPGHSFSLAAPNQDLNANRIRFLEADVQICSWKDISPTLDSDDIVNASR